MRSIFGIDCTQGPLTRSEFQQHRGTFKGLQVEKTPWSQKGFLILVIKRFPYYHSVKHYFLPLDTSNLIACPHTVPVNNVKSVLHFIFSVVFYFFSIASANAQNVDVSPLRLSTTMFPLSFSI